uniref:Phosphatidate cytidylyltransferase n=1 Tax=Peronospora matthiolae TaxID=2874970 RepID=A0AAV1UFR6_9STRA
MAASPPSPLPTPSPEPLSPHRTPTSRSFSPMSITPRSSDSSPAFFYHSTTTSDTSFEPVASSSSDLSTNVAATTRCWLHRNAVQRVLSALFLMPLITVFLWLSPAFATATFCTFVTSICSYEYAWLHYRIYERISTKLHTSESRLTHRNATTDFSTARPEPLDNNRRSVNSCCSNDNSRCSSRSIVANDDRETRHEYGGDGGRGRTGGSTTGETAVLSPLGFPPQPRASFGPHSLEHLANEQEEPSRVGSGIDEDDAEDASFSRSAVTGLANRYFHHNEWIAAIVLSTVTTVCTTAMFLTYVDHVPELHEKQLYELRWFYSIATDFVAALCAFSTPDWTYACVCLVEKMIFTLLTMHSTACPINRFRCGISLEPAQVFLAGVAVIVLLRRHTSSSGPSVFLHIALDVLGYLYIIGSLSVIVAFVDDERLESYRKLLIVLLYVVWASDTGAYITGKLLERMHYRHYNPLASHLSKNKDYEGTVGAVVFGVSAMFISSDLLNVPGSAVAQIGFTVLAVIVGRLGDLFESLLKRAAGVKDSGKLIPGHGGVLDRIDALMFASLVFARYYASIVV